MISTQKKAPAETADAKRVERDLRKKRERSVLRFRGYGDRVDVNPISVVDLTVSATPRCRH